MMDDGRTDDDLEFELVRPAELIAERNLTQIATDALGNLEAAAREAEDLSEIGEQLMYDAGEVWRHDQIPEGSLDHEEVDERIEQLISHARTLPTETTAMRFLFDDHVYVLAIYLTKTHEAGLLLRTWIEEPGKLAEIEHLDAAPYLGRGSQ